MRKFLQRNVWQTLAGIECSVKYEVKITTNTFKEQQNNCNYYFTNFIFFFCFIFPSESFFFYECVVVVFVAIACWSGALRSIDVGLCCELANEATAVNNKILPQRHIFAKADIAQQ